MTSSATCCLVVDVEGRMGQRWHAISTTQSCKLRDKGRWKRVWSECASSKRTQSKEAIWMQRQISLTCSVCFFECFLPFFWKNIYYGYYLSSPKKNGSEKFHPDCKGYYWEGPVSIVLMSTWCKLLPRFNMKSGVCTKRTGPVLYSIVSKYRIFCERCPFVKPIVPFIASFMW